MNDRRFTFVRAAGSLLFALTLLACSGENGTSTGSQADVDVDASTSPVDPPGTDAARPHDSGTARDAAPPRMRGVYDRAGRPLASQLLTSDVNRDVYNRWRFGAWVDPAVAADGGAPLGSDFQSRLVALDRLDAVDDWHGGEGDAGPDPDSGIYPHPFTDAWLTDVIVVDPEQPFSRSGYLDVETSGGRHTTCGGRWLADDAIDKTLSYLISASTTGVSDGVAAATKSPSLAFPYLAPPN